MLVFAHCLCMYHFADRKSNLASRFFSHILFSRTPNARALCLCVRVRVCPVSRSLVTPFTLALTNSPTQPTNPSTNQQTNKPQQTGGKITQRYTSALLGFAAELPDNSFQTLSTHPKLDYIEADGPVSAYVASHINK